MQMILPFQIAWKSSLIMLKKIKMWYCWEQDVLPLMKMGEKLKSIFIRKLTAQIWLGWKHSDHLFPTRLLYSKKSVRKLLVGIEKN